VPAPGVLANDSDADTPSLQAGVATNPSHGTLALQPSGAFTYTPAAGFSGTDSFTYQVTDQTSISAPVMVALTVTVNECAPRPADKVTTTVNGGKLTAHVQASPLNTQQPNPLKSLRFGTLQNAKVAVAGQPITNGQTVALPANSSTVDLTVERVTPGQATTVPFTVIDGCGEWQTFVGGGPRLRLLTVAAPPEMSTTMSRSGHDGPPGRPYAEQVRRSRALAGGEYAASAHPPPLRHAIVGPSRDCAVSHAPGRGS